MDTSVNETDQLLREELLRDRMHGRLARQGHRQERRAATATAPPGLTSALLGVNISPVLAATLRALAYIVLTAAADAAILYFTSTPPAALAIYSAIIVGALRQIEGVLDQVLKGNASAAGSG